jgi:hypothetical protein
VSIAPIRELPLPTIVFQISDQVTEHAGALQTSAVAIMVDVAAKHCRLLKDLELLESLNQLSIARSEPRAAPPEVGQALELARVESPKPNAGTPSAICGARRAGTGCPVARLVLLGHKSNILV